MTDAIQTCVVCGASLHRMLFPVTDIFGNTRNVHACEHCGAWFLVPYPTKEDLAAAYSDDYYGASETKFRWGAIETVLNFFRKGRARLIFRYTRGKGEVLDVGCGNGMVLHQLSGMGAYHLHGTEMPGNSAERAVQHPEINLHIGTLLKAPFTDGQFDAITLFHVLEHLPEPLQYLDRANALLKPGGVLMISFPNLRSWQARIFGPHWLHLDPPRHLFLPDYKYLITLLRQKGFTCVRRSFFSPEQNPMGAVQSLLNKHGRVRDFLFERLKGNTAYHSEMGPGRLVWHKLFFILAMPVFILTDALASLSGRSATVFLVFRKGGSNDVV